MIIVADIGGTHLRIAASDTPDTFEEPVVVDTPVAFDEGVAAFAAAVRTAAKDRPVTGAVAGIAGVFSRDRHMLLISPHLPEWCGRDIAGAFSAAISAPVEVENDVVLGALGEAHHGAGRGAAIVVYVAVGTGVGGARVSHGAVEPATFGFEIGHQLLGTGEGAPEWESLISGTGIENRYNAPAAEITDPAVWERCADDFAYGLYNTLLHWSPERVVLGGSAFKGTAAIPLERVRTTLGAINQYLPELPELCLAELDYPGLYGALVRSAS